MGNSFLNGCRSLSNKLKFSTEICINKPYHVVLSFRILAQTIRWKILESVPSLEKVYKPFFN